MIFLCVSPPYREKSLELKRSFSCPSPTPPFEHESPLQTQRSTPPHHFKVPHYPSRSRRTPKQRKPRPQRPHPYQHSDQDYPSLPNGNTHPSQYVTSSPSSSFSYAQATQPRAGKRSFSDRICLSPIDHVPKRHALSGLQSTPPEPLLTRLNTTPKDHFTEELMEICDVNETTPGGER